MNQSVELYQLAVCKPGHRFGYQIIKFILAEVFQEQRKNRLWLEVFPENAVARKLYSRCGFVEEGTLREAYFWDGNFQSAIIMSILASDFRAR